MKISLLALGFLAAHTAQAQSGAAGFFNPLSASRNGIHLYSASVYGGYFSGGNTFGLPATSMTPGLQQSGTFSIAGASANFGLSRTGERASFSIRYAPSYVAYPDRTDLNAMGHSFSLNWNRKLGRRWSLDASAMGLVAKQEQSYFSSNAFGIAASLPATFEDLAGAITSGKLTDTQLAALLTGSSVRALPEQTYLYGQRIGSGSVYSGISYAPSERSSFHVSASVNRVQGLPAEKTGSEAAPALIRTTTTGSATFGWRYSLSPRTSIGIEVGTSRTISRQQDAYASSTSFSLSRTVTQHWFIQARAGGGMLSYARNELAASQRPQYTAGASTGYKFRSNTLLASYERTIGDAYGLGAAHTSVATAGWARKTPGSAWSLHAEYGYQQTAGSPLLNTESWRAMGGLARSLTNHLFIGVQYAYFAYPPRPEAITGLLSSGSGLNVSLSWSPSQYR
jgi:hypothetical protein